jgi:hypothetical protein
VGRSRGRRTKYNSNHRLVGRKWGRVLLVPSLDERAALGVLSGMLHEYIVRPMEKVKTIFIMST